MPKGYTLEEENVPNPHPIGGWEDCQTRWTEDNKNYVWEDGNIYSKPAPTEITTAWVQHPAVK